MSKLLWDSKEEHGFISASKYGCVITNAPRFKKNNSTNFLDMFYVVTNTE
jgi:hypothetical protein